METPKDRRVLVGGAVALGLAVLLGGYLYVAAAGAERFEDYLYDHDLRDALDYRDVAYSPLRGRITLEDVELEIPLLRAAQPALRGGNAALGAILGGLTGQPKPEPVIFRGHLDALSIGGLTDEDALDVRFRGYRLVTDPTPTERAENLVYQVLAAPLATLLELGVMEARLAGGFAYAYDRDDDVLSIALHLDADQLASHRWEVELGRARKLLRASVSDLLLGALADPSGPLGEFGRVELISLEAGVRDHGVIRRLAHLRTLADFRYDEALNGDMEIEAVAYRTRREAEQGREELRGLLDEESIEAWSRFLTQGGDLDVSVSTQRPVPISRLVKEGKPPRDLEIEIDG